VNLNIEPVNSFDSGLNCFVYAPNAKPLCVSYGMGVDSTAMLVGLQARGIRPDSITFADTGGEKRETYEYLPIIQAWCEYVGFPEIVVVRRVRTKRAPYSTLEENCIVNKTLPGIAFGGRKSCSPKWKSEPMEKYRATLPMVRDAWKRGELAMVCIGYDAGPKDARRPTIANDKRYAYLYPLRVWGWDREECKRRILAAGLPVPMKSACWFCPANKPAEIAAMDDADHGIGDRIMAMEANAEGRQQERRDAGKKAILGLWGMGCKGMRGAEKKPGRMTDFILAHRAGRSLPVIQTESEGCHGGC